MADVAVLGSGGWGIALSIYAHSLKHNVKLWSFFEKEVEQLKHKRENKKLLKGISVPNDIEITTDINCAVGADMVIIAVPSFVVRKTAALLKGVKAKFIINASKGLEEGSFKRMSTVISEELPNAVVITLSGPSHAEEVARGIPTSLVAAHEDEKVCDKVIDAFCSDRLRIYSNTDILGVEFGGALKNIIAVASGFCDGMGLGDNSRAALITRGLTEIARLGVCCGGNERTFAGLSGLGDLVVTCTSVHSRNHRFGMKVAQGMPVEKALEEVGTVEGYHATRQAYLLAEKMNVEIPITEYCYKVLFEGLPVKEALAALMSRPAKNETEALWL